MNQQEYNEDMAKDWIKEFEIVETNICDEPFLFQTKVNIEEALKNLFTRQLILIEEQSRFQDRIEKLEKLAKKVEGLI